MSAEVIVSFKKVGDEDVMRANKAVAKSVADLKRLASTPIETKFAKDQIPQGFDRLKAQVISAREELKKLHEEMGRPMKAAPALKIPKLIDPMAAANKQMAEMRSTAATPIESSAFKSAAGGDFEAIKARVLAARDAVTKFNQEMGKSPNLKGDTRAIDAAIASTTGKLENLRKLAATPIHSQAFKQMAGSDYGAIQNKVLGARAALEGKSYKDLGSSASWASNMMGNLKAKMEEMKDKAKDAGVQVGFLGRLLAAMAVRAAVHSMIEFADSFTNLQNKIKTVTDGEGSLKYISKQLNEIAQTSRTSIGSVVTAFTRTSRAVSVLGKSQAETLQFTDTLSKAIQVGGSTATEASNAMIQLSQGMSSGALRGDELRSVLEQLPVVAQLIATKMGVTVGQLRELGAAGKITTDIVFDSITGATESVEAKFSKMQLTLSQAFVKLGNSMTQWAGNLNGVMSALAGTVDYVANHFEDLVTVLESLALGAIPLLASRAIPWLIGAFNALKLAFATNPIGFTITAVATLTAAIAPLVAGMKISETSAVTWGDTFKAVFSSVGQEVKNVFFEMGNSWTAFKEALGVYETPPALKQLQNDMKAVSDATREEVMAKAKNADFYMGGTANQRIARETLRLMDLEAEQKQVKKLVEASQLAEAKIKDDRYAGASLGVFKSNQEKKKKGSDPGMTLSEMQRQLQQETDKLEFGYTSAKDRTIDSRVFEQTIEAIDKLKKSEKIKLIDNPALMTSLESTIRIKEEWKDYYEWREQARKENAEAEKKAEEDANKRIDEYLDKQKKIAEEIKKRQTQDISTHLDERQSIAESLDPGLAINQEIERLQIFKNEMKDFPQWVELATDKIEKLKTSMILDGAFMDFANQLNGIFGPGGVMVRGFADVAARAVVMNMSLRDTKAALRELLSSIQQQALSSLFQLPMNILMNPATYAGAAPSATPGVTSWSGAANMPAGWSTGGYTGNGGVNEPAGIVHGQEYVVNAEATRKYRPMLEAINKGKPMSAPSGKGAASSSQPVINITNNTPAQVSTQVSPTTGEIEVMINQAIAQKAPGVIARQLSDPNSNVSRALGKNTSSERRRT